MPDDARDFRGGPFGWVRGAAEARDRPGRRVAHISLSAAPAAPRGPVTTAGEPKAKPISIPLRLRAVTRVDASASGVCRCRSNRPTATGTAARQPLLCARLRSGGVSIRARRRRFDRGRLAVDRDDAVADTQACRRRGSPGSIASTCVLGTVRRHCRVEVSRARSSRSARPASSTPQKMKNRDQQVHSGSPRGSPRSASRAAACS